MCEKERKKLAHYENALEKLRELRNKKQQETFAGKEKLHPLDIKFNAGYVKALFDALEIFEEIK